MTCRSIIFPRLYVRSFRFSGRQSRKLELVIQLPLSRLYSSTFHSCEQRNTKEVECIKSKHDSEEGRRKHNVESDVNDDGDNRGRRVEKKPPSWIEHDAIPSWIKPYMKLARVDKQVGTALLFWPCLWSISLAAPVGMMPDLVMVLKFATGAIIMRSAGCVINDIWDRDFDKHVERTKDRPLASGELSLNQALVFLGLNLSCGLAVLTSLNMPCIKLGFLVMPLVICYPLMKRMTNFPQLVLGMTFNWGALMGWTAIMGETSLYHTFPLYISGVCWTLIYDTLYGYQDRKDDLKLGLKSTSLYLGEKPQVPLSILCGAMVAGLVRTGYTNDLSLPYYALVSVSSGQLLWQIWSADLNDPKNLWTRFDSNKYIGGVLAAAIVAGKIC